MPRRRAVDLIAQANTNDYKRGAYRDLDVIRRRRKHVEEMKRNQDATFQRHIM
ncbi:hypothetical protein ABVK25_003298 [Lepraria finkii]|uniref:Uncharacterized protein n=1 Tax=Lepraria finkii TaxID=1340010 RepID=A0ABR4BEY8_9LECA